jgi:hypothetical protein
MSRSSTANAGPVHLRLAARAIRLGMLGANSSVISWQSRFAAGLSSQSRVWGGTQTLPSALGDYPPVGTDFE